MQYIRYENCGSEECVRQEIQRLVREGFLTQEQGDAVDSGEIAKFFASAIGTKLRQGNPHLREFKFSILDDARKYGCDLEEEQVLLQGVVDCALLEEDGITILDFKTDHVTEKTLSDAVQRYTTQVQTYGEALSRIYEMPVKKKYLYFFRLGRFVEV
jgi:ATP-dependent helicase/nuclease subunit A